MSLGLNGRFLAVGRPTGVQRFAWEIGKRLLEPLDLTLFVPGGRLGPWGPSALASCRRVIRGRFSGHLWEQLKFPFGADQLGVDLAVNLANSAPLLARRQVVVVQDLTPLTHPHWYSRRFAAWFRWLIPRVVRQAERVLVPSQWVASECMRWLGLPAMRLVVVPQGIGPFEGPAAPGEVAGVLARYGLQPGYLLAIGGGPRKNVAFLSEVLRCWRSRRGAAPPLVVVGEEYLWVQGRRRWSERREALERQVRYLGYVPDEDLRALYTAAAVFCFPSLAEGFGRPPLEAMACGVPVVAGDYAAAREVLSGGGLVLPYEAPLWSEILERLLEDTGLRQEQAARGSAWVRRFSWDGAAGIVRGVLEDLEGVPGGGTAAAQPRGSSRGGAAAFRVALVHDWLTGMRGGERVLEAFLDLFPRAEIFTLIHVPGSVSRKIEERRIHTSLLSRLPAIGRTYRYYLPLFPLAVRGFDLRGFDLVVSISHCVAKGVRVPAGVPHVCYCLTPMRYVWHQYQAYFGPGRASWPVRVAALAVRPWLRRWDVETAKGVTRFLACSEHVREQIRRRYGREAEVVHPAVEASGFHPAGKREEFFLTVSALVPYKRVDCIVEAFARLKRPLVVVGEGSERGRLERLAERRGAAAWIRFAGRVPSEEVARLMGRCRAFVYAAEEDFGMVYVEALAAGAPVVAYGRGGIRDVYRVSDGWLTDAQGRLVGVSFETQSVAAVVEAVARLEGTQCSGNGGRVPGRFGRGAFEAAIRKVVVDLMGLEHWPDVGPGGA